MSIKNNISSLLRSLRLLERIDKLRFRLHYLKNWQNIQEIKKLHHDFIFPPAYYIYETYHLDYNDYYQDGLQTAKDIIRSLRTYIDVNHKGFKILDWGCGPGRVIRHMANVLPFSKCYGSDYNPQYIAMVLIEHK